MGHSFLSSESSPGSFVSAVLNLELNLVVWWMMKLPIELGWVLQRCTINVTSCKLVWRGLGIEIGVLFVHMSKYKLQHVKWNCMENWHQSSERHQHTDVHTLWKSNWCNNRHLPVRNVDLYRCLYFSNTDFTVLPKQGMFVMYCT